MSSRNSNTAPAFSSDPAFDASTLDYIASVLPGMREHLAYAGGRGGVATTLLAACSALAQDFEILAEREVSRIESKDLEHFRERNTAKTEAGIGSYKR